MRGDQTSRQWHLVRLLSGPRGRTLAQLRAELGVSKRTVQRDIDALERGGFPITSEERNGTVFWRFMEHFRVDAPLSLELSELMALYFSRRLLEPLKGSAIYEAIDSVMAKIASAVAAAEYGFIREAESGIAVSTFGGKDYSRSRDCIRALTKAIYQHLSVEMKHAAAGKNVAIHRTVDPYKLWYANGGLYLVGWDYQREEILSFAVERIRSVELTKRRFKLRPDFDFEKTQQNAFHMIWGKPQNVRLRFAASQAQYATERTWHTSQQITPERDGSVVIELRVGDLSEVKRWLIGWGADVEVLHPPELRECIVTEAEKIMNRGRVVYTSKLSNDS